MSKQLSKVEIEHIKLNKKRVRWQFRGERVRHIYGRERLKLLRGEAIELDIAGVRIRDMTLPPRGTWILAHEVLRYILPKWALVWPLYKESKDWDDSVYVEILPFREGYGDVMAFIATVEFMDAKVVVNPVGVRGFNSWRDVLKDALIYCVDFQCLFPYAFYKLVRKHNLDFTDNARRFAHRYLNSMDGVLHDWALALKHNREPIIPFVDEVLQALKGGNNAQKEKR